MKCKTTKRALFFDIDGTLVHRHRVSDRTIKMLLKARNAGHYLFINTGRSRGFLPDYLLSKIVWDGYVCGGGYVEYAGKVLMDERLERSLVDKLCRFAESTGLRIILEGTERCYTLNGQIKDFVLLSSADAVAAHFDELKITKVTFMNVLSDSQVALFGDDLNIIRMNNYTEAYKKGYSKANGMAILMKELGLSREDIVAFGDSPNDKEMLAAAGTRVVMRQAPHEIKKLASIVTRSPHSGVAEGIRRLKLYRK